MDETDIELGQRVRDRVSGFEGIVTDIGTHITGCTRLGVWPADDGPNTARGENEFFYESQLEVIEEDTEFTEEAQESITSVDFYLGDQVRDEITGFEGVATTITFNLWNCPRVAIDPTGSEAANENKDRKWVDAPRVERTGAGVSADFAEMQEKAEVATGAAEDLQRKEDAG